MNRNKLHRKGLGEKGFSLAELLISMVILLFVSLVMMQTAIVGIDSNTRNALRDEASRLAEEVMNEKLRNLTIDERADLVGPTNSQLYTRPFRRQDVDFTAEWNAAPLSGSTYKLVTVTVKWDWKDESFQVESRSIME